MAEKGIIRFERNEFFVSFRGPSLLIRAVDHDENFTNSAII